MKRAIVSLCAVPLLLLASSASPSPPDPSKTTTAQFLSACDTDPNWCQMQVSIEHSAAAWNTANSHVCTPAGWDAGTMTAPILAWMRAHSETGMEKASSTLRTAMIALWPCG